MTYAGPFDEPLMLYVGIANSDGTEGRGWGVPTMISNSLSYLLTWSQNNPRNHVSDDIHIFSEESGWRSFYQSHQKRFSQAPEIEARWQKFLELTDRKPPLAVKPEATEVYGVVGYENRQMGDMRYPDQPALRSIFKDYESALADCGDGEEIFRIQTEHDYGTLMFKGSHSPIPSAEQRKSQWDASKSDAQQLEDLTRFFG